ncbi:hypothetical protein HY382_00130 [Candidatus Curtissbacteria bacterium]|nr:hypothetical protein [Candidatus Curtissbacteria bacterium]
MSERKTERSTKIVRNENGQAVFEGTQFLIHQIISRANVIGNIKEARREFIEGYPHLSPAHFDTSQVYYQKHKEEIDEVIKKERRLLAVMVKHNVPGRGVDFDALEADPEYQTLEQSTR